jgi:transposase
MPDVLVPDDAAGLRAANARLRRMMPDRDADIAGLRLELDAARDRERRLELRLAELERRLGMDSSNSGTPSSKERIGAKAERKARRREESERERSKDRKRGGQPGHPGKSLARDPDLGEKREAPPPAECRKCKASLAGAAPAGKRWAQSRDVEVIRMVTEWLLPGLACPCCGEVTFAAPPPGLHAGSVSYGPVLNAAAVMLTAYGNVPPERAAQVIGMLLGARVSAGWVDKASARLSALLGARAAARPAARRPWLPDPDSGPLAGFPDLAGHLDYGRLHGARAEVSACTGKCRVVPVRARRGE